MMEKILCLKDDESKVANQPPLGQRKSGTRSQRRVARMQQAKAECSAPKEEETAQESREQQNQEQRRGPSKAIECLIDAAIAERARVNQSIAAMQDISVGYDENSDIIGDYEYMDHTADIQLHSWGETLEKALEQLAVAMFGYMTKISLIEIDMEASEANASNVLARAHDLNSLVFAFLQEWLYIFHDTGFVGRVVNINSLDLNNFIVKSSGKGEKLCLERHEQGTEIKAITYSNLQVMQDKDRCDIWVIVDI